MQLRRSWLQKNNIKMWSRDKQRCREWKHPLMQRHIETKGNTPERLTVGCLILERMWEKSHHNTGREGLESTTLDTWLLWAKV